MVGASSGILSRRGFLKGAAATAGAAAGSDAITGFPTIWAQTIKDITLTHLGQSFSAMPQIAAQASKDLGFTVTMQVVDGATELNRIFTQPDSLDVTDISLTQIPDLAREKLIQPIPIKRYQWWNDTSPLFTKGEYPDGRKASMQGAAPVKTQYYTDASGTKFSQTPTDWLTSIPSLYDADTLGIRPDLIKRKVVSWADLVNPEFKGRTALQSNAEVGVIDAAMALQAAGLMHYVDMGNMTRDEIRKTLSILTDLKSSGQFRSFWTNFDQSVSLMASGEVVIQSMFAPAVTEVRTRNIACEFVPLREGYRGWGLALVPMRHLTGMKLDAALDYFNWYNSGWMGAFIAKTGYYSTVAKTTQSHLSPPEWDYWYGGKVATQDIYDPFGKLMEKAGVTRDGGSIWQRMGNIAVWNSIMDQGRYLTLHWNEFLSA